jgi:plasmid stabilization system protein ParE
MPRVKRRPLAQTDILEIWDVIADDRIDVVRVLHGARYRCDVQSGTLTALRHDPGYRSVARPRLIRSGHSL